MESYTGRQNLTFFCALDEINKSLLILGRHIRIRYWFFSITSGYCSIANFMVARSKNQFSAFYEKSMGDIKNLKSHWRFKIKFGAFKKEEIENRMSRSRDIGNLTRGNVEKTTFFDKIFSLLFF